MCHLGREQYWIAIQPGESILVNVERVVPGDRQGVKVRQRTAAGEDSASVGPEAELAGDSLGQLNLEFGEHRRHLHAQHIVVDCRGDQITQH